MADSQQHPLLIHTTGLAVKSWLLDQQHWWSMTCCAFRSPKSWTLVCSKKRIRTLGSPVLFKGHLEKPLFLVGSKRAKKRSGREKWTDINTKTSQINPSERPNLLKLSNMNRQEMWDPRENALVRVTRCLWASPLSRHPAAGAAQLSRNFQDKQLQGCPPLSFGSLTAHCKPLLHITNYRKLYYTLL